MTKRIISLLLCIIMAVGTLACGSGEASGDSTTPSDTADTSAPVAEGPKSGVPEGTRFDGQTARILNGQYYDNRFYLMDASESTGDTLNDAVYNRNLAVMDRLGIEFEITSMLDTYGNNAASDAYVKTIEAGDQEWDIFTTCQYLSMTKPQNGQAYKLSESDYFNWDSPWWSKDYIEAMNFGLDNVYLVGGDISIVHLNQATCVLYNKSLVEDYYKDGDLPYDEVLAGKWTLDRLYEISSTVWKDTNGNNKIDIDDTVGLVGAAESFEQSIHCFYGAGGFTTEAGDDGKLIISPLAEKNVNITEKIYKLMWENPGFVNASGGVLDMEVDAPAKFSEGNIMFMCSYLYHADMLRDMEDAYGIVPYPKYSEDDDYNALLANHAATFMIPSVTSTADMACAVIEEMAYQGWATMMPIYYETALKTKYVRGSEEKAAKVIDIIRDSVMTDAGFAHDLGRVAYTVYWCIREKNTNYASGLASVMAAAEEALAKKLEYYGN